MTKKEIQVWRTKRDNVYLLDGKEVVPPAEWAFIPSGDPGLTRRLKADGPYWVVVHRRKNRLESLGLLADGSRAQLIRSLLERERKTPAYQHKLEAAKKAREKKQDEYVIEFRQAVVNFLAFAPRYSGYALTFADAVTDHAVPVGSGTVARTERIPVERRAEAAVIAWMRHQTTAYDHMTIRRIKGERREVRRILAGISRQLLQKYRSGEEIDFVRCPLAQALDFRKNI